MPTVFEWNERKDRANRRKHGVGFSEAPLFLPIRLLGFFRTKITPATNIARSSLATLRRTGSRSPNRPPMSSESSALAQQLNESNRTMKKTSEGRRNNKELRTEYRFDYSKSKPNRFTARTRRQGIAVLLDPDVARVFKSAESVNKALCALLNAVPRRRTVSR